jgi:hypothetical protein
MTRTIRALALAGLFGVVLSAWMAHTYSVDMYSPATVAYMPVLGINLSFVLQLIFATSALLSFSAGLLSLTLTVPRRHQSWSAALLVSLLLNGYLPLAFYGLWWMLIPSLANAVAERPIFSEVIVYGFVPAIPALLALGYGIRVARRTPQATPTLEEQESLDITIEPIRSKIRQ